jgi:hypothetical protein
MKNSIVIFGMPFPFILCHLQFLSARSYRLFSLIWLNLCLGILFIYFVSIVNEITFFFSVWYFELRALSLQGKCFTIWAKPPGLFVLDISQTGLHGFFFFFFFFANKRRKPDYRSESPHTIGVFMISILLVFYLLDKFAKFTKLFLIWQFATVFNTPTNDSFCQLAITTFLVRKSRVKQKTEFLVTKTPSLTNHYPLLN